MSAKKVTNGSGKFAWRKCTSSSKIVSCLLSSESPLGQSGESIRNVIAFARPSEFLRKYKSFERQIKILFIELDWFVTHTRWFRFFAICSSRSNQSGSFFRISSKTQLILHVCWGSSSRSRSKNDEIYIKRQLLWESILVLFCASEAFFSSLIFFYRKKTEQ